MKPTLSIFMVLLYIIALCSCEESSNSTVSYATYDYIEDRVVTSDTFVDGNRQISFRGNSVKLVWKNKYKDGHQFRAYVKPGHNVVRTTECDYCGHMYYVHYD